MDWWAMKIPIPFVRCEIEIVVRRRTEPIRFRVRTLMIATALAALIVYLMLPLSAADRRLMATYEQLGNYDPNKTVTRTEIISQLGPPSSADIPTTPKQAPGYTWVAEFETPLEYRQFTLNLSFSTNDGDGEVIAWGLYKTEFQGIELLWFRIERLIKNLGF
jgi:hypothetical protein